MTAGCTLRRMEGDEGPLGLPSRDVDVNSIAATTCEATSVASRVGGADCFFMEEGETARSVSEVCMAGQKMGLARQFAVRSLLLHDGQSTRYNLRPSII